MRTEYKILLLVLVNVLWGIIPWPAAKLFEEYSLFLIIFSRFIIMGLFLVGLTILLIHRANRPAVRKQTPIRLRHLIIYLKSPNHDFLKLPQWVYLLILAIIGVNGNVVLFFWGLKTIGAVITAIGFIIALILTASINWGLGKEEMTSFKFLYLITLFVAMIIIGLAGQSTDPNSSQQIVIDANALIITGSYGVALAFFLIASGADKKSQKEYEIQRLNKGYPFIRTIFKLGVLSIFAATTLIPILVIINHYISTPEIVDEVELFFIQFPNWWRVATNGSGLVLIFICTILTYIVFFWLAANWPKETSFDLWAGVLQILEPILNIIIGTWILNELFPISWLIIVSFLMIVAIILRYISETEAQVNAILLLKINPKYTAVAMEKAYTIKQIRAVSTLIGEFDLMCQVQIPSQKLMNKLMNREIPNIPGVRGYQFIIITKQQKNDKEQ